MRYEAKYQGTYIWEVMGELFLDPHEIQFLDQRRLSVQLKKQKRRGGGNEKRKRCLR